ncbi:hydrolase [Fervidicella metallireducens AeB]|uniref:Hydrolase n=1 Tax=Fervidicella metallireducens AeB TaxID=1403537 RepID=A0A017RVB9_9CLOT|nr:phosphatase [Fervidicella metallireducens]EYE88607.1 hydrolase [Fervidicella metallireducens AeB]
MKKMVVDTHTHTIASGHAYSTLIENCFEASEKGIKLIAMTDHGPAMPGGPHIFHFGNLKVIPDIIHGVEVLKGAEVNILDFNGKIDLNEGRLRNLDIVVASLHDVCITPGSKKDNTNALIGAMKNKYVDIIAHPGNPAFEIDVKEVLKAAKEYNVLIEINNSSLGFSRPGSFENCTRIAEKAAELNNMITLGSDAHICYHVGEFQNALKMLESVGFNENYIINTDENRLKDYLKSKGKLQER